MYKLIFSLSFFIFCITSICAQDYQPTASEMEAIKVLEAGVFATYTSGESLHSSSYSFSENGEFDEFTAQLLSPLDSKTPDRHTNHVKYVFDRPSGKKISRVKMFRDDCEYTRASFTWKGDKITNIRVASNSYKVEYDDRGRVSKLDKGMTQNSSSGIYKERATFLTYDDQDRLIKAEEKYTNYKGKSREKLKVYFTYTNMELNCVYGDNSISTESKSYRSKKKPKDPTTVTQTTNAVYTQNRNTYIREKTGDVFGKGGKRRKVTTYTKIYDSTNYLKEYLIETEEGVQKSLYERDNRGNAIKTIQKYIATDGTIKSENITEVEYDANGMSSKTKYSSKKDGKFDTRTEIEHNWVSSKSRISTCGLTDKSYRKTFNEQGKIIRENGPKGVRVRLPNGSWGPWKGYSM